MTMWTTPEAINAELEYRRESLTRHAKVIRIGRQRRAERAERRRAEREHATGERAEHGAAERGQQRRETTLPAQRTSGDHAATKQPV